MTAPARRRTSLPPGLTVLRRTVGATGRVEAYRTPYGPYAYKITCRTCWEPRQGGVAARKWRIKPTTDINAITTGWAEHTASEKHRKAT